MDLTKCKDKDRRDERNDRIGGNIEFSGNVLTRRRNHG